GSCGNPLEAISSALGGEQGVISSYIGDEQGEQEAYQAELNQRKNDEDIEECLHKTDDEMFQIGAARDTVTRAVQDVENAKFALDAEENAIRGWLDASAGQLATEASLTATPPHLHYWLDENIAVYHRHMEYARRLTYLAVRAFEYESQQ